MQDNVLGENLRDTKVFKDYESNFKPTPVTKTLQKEWFAKSNFYKAGLKENSKEYKILLSGFLSSDEYKQLEGDEYCRQFVIFAKEIESRKLTVYIQIENNLVAILQTPPERVGKKSNKAEVIRFLGYDWSNRKGDEGIKYLTSHVLEPENSEDDDDKDAEIVKAINSIKYIETPLYNPNDDNDVTKFAYALRKHTIDSCNKFSFDSAIKCINKPFAGEDDSLLHYYKLADLIDFSRATFNLAIRTSNDNNKDLIKYKVPVKEYKLSDNALFELYIGKRVLNSEMKDDYDVPVYSANVSKPFGYINKLLINDFSRPSIIWGIDGDWMVNCIPEEQKFYPTDHCGVLRCKTDDINPYFLALILEIEGNSCGFKRDFRASLERIKSLSVKVPSILLQQKIVSECQNLDEESQKAVLHRELIDDDEQPVSDEAIPRIKKPTIIIWPKYRKGCIPFYSVRAACGYFEESRTLPPDDAEGWVDVSENGIKVNNNMFIVRAVGNSMEPKINDGDLCVFELYGTESGGSRDGEIVLTQSIDKDGDYDCAYTIKKYHSEKLQNEDGSWKHTKVELQSLNPVFSTIEVSPEDASSLRTIGILRAVL